MYECLPAYMYVQHMLVWCPKRALDPQKLELQLIMSCPMGSGNKIQVLCKTSKCS